MTNEKHAAFVNRISIFLFFIVVIFSLLRYVGFSQNNLSKIPFALGRAASELYVLDYAENNLRELPQIPKTLRQIYLTGNHIKRISFQPLENATMLYELFLHDNDVEEIEENAFAHSPLIGWLDLSVRKDVLHFVETVI